MSGSDRAERADGARRRRDAERVRRAAAHPDRPGRGCKADPGAFRPVVALTRCEGKADCVAVCPYDVFAIGPVPEADYRALPWPARVKLWAHGKTIALTPNLDACRACGLCVVACPEQAITLVERPA